MTSMNIVDALQQGLENHQSGNLQKAENIYKEILIREPDNFYASNYLGVLYCQIGNYDLAISYIEKAIQLDRDNSHAHYNLGIAFQGKASWDEAIAAYKDALRLNPGNADAFVNLGIVYKYKGLLDEAITCFRTALKLKPDLLPACNNLGTVLRQKGLIEDSIIFLQKGLQLNPNSAEILFNLGVSLQEKGDLDGAIFSYQKALNIHLSPIVLYNLGTALMEKGDTDEAAETFKRVLCYEPTSFVARLAYCISRILVIPRNEPSLLLSRQSYYEELTKLRDSLSLSNSVEIEEASKAIGTVQPFYLAYQGLNDHELQGIYGDLLCRIMRLRYPQFAERPVVPLRREEEPMRVGFVSGHFCNHAVWNIPTKGWLDNLDKDRFELYGYYTWTKKDEKTAAARNIFKRFTEDIYSFEDLCNTIKKDNLHLLIFPEIGMDPVTLKLATLRLAPVQCASWGHPTTSGLPTIDYYLSSDLMEPPDGDKHYTEKLIRLPNLSIYYTPVDVIKADVNRHTFNLRPDSLVYHCCQSPFKYLPQYDEVFPRIAREVENCRFLFASHPRSELITELFRRRIYQAFTQAGMNAEKFVLFLPFLEVKKYNALYLLSDVFLDPIGWSGCNSALEAISCNLPVVTFPGELMRSRDSFAVLTMMGVKETIAYSLDQYVEVAVKLGQDPEWRKHIGQKISVNKSRVYRDMTCIYALQDFLERAMRQ